MEIYNCIVSDSWSFDLKLVCNVLTLTLLLTHLHSLCDLSSDFSVTLVHVTVFPSFELTCYLCLDLKNWKDHKC